jgi:hypothetical protein
MMAFLPLVELAVTILLIVTVATQIFIPLIRGEAWFPILRRSGTLEKQLDKLHSQMSEEQMRAQIASLEAKLNKKETVSNEPSNSNPVQ